jgi:lantibiotic modifying enzyme
LRRARSMRHIPEKGFTRRSFLGASALGAVAAQPVIPLLFSSNNARAAAPDDSYLDAAEQAACWISSARVSKANGIGWLPDPDHSEKLTSVGPDNTIYSGSAGTVLFLLELAAATGEQSYVEEARRGADYLVSSWKNLPGSTASLLPDQGLPFDQGLAGVAFTLAETWKVTQVAAYRDAALAATRTLAGAAAPVGKGVQWLPSPAVGLGGGVILYLLYAAVTFKQDNLLKLAVRGGNRIIELGQLDARGGLRWQGLPESSSLKAATHIPQDAYFPNFELEPRVLPLCSRDCTKRHASLRFCRPPAPVPGTFKVLPR